MNINEIRTKPFESCLSIQNEEQQLLFMIKKLLLILQEGGQLSKSIKISHIMLVNSSTFIQLNQPKDNYKHIINESYNLRKQTSNITKFRIQLSQYCQKIISKQSQLFNPTTNGFIYNLFKKTLTNQHSIIEIFIEGLICYHDILEYLSEIKQKNSEHLDFQFRSNMSQLYRFIKVEWIQHIIEYLENLLIYNLDKQQ